MYHKYLLRDFAAIALLISAGRSETALWVIRHGETIEDARQGLQLEGYDSFTEYNTALDPGYVQVGETLTVPYVQSLRPPATWTTSDSTTNLLLRCENTQPANSVEVSISEGSASTTVANSQRNSALPNPKPGSSSSAISRNGLETATDAKQSAGSITKETKTSHSSSKGPSTHDTEISSSSTLRPYATSSVGNGQSTTRGSSAGSTEHATQSLAASSDSNNAMICRDDWSAVTANETQAKFSSMFCDTYGDVVLSKSSDSVTALYDGGESTIYQFTAQWRPGCESSSEATIEETFSPCKDVVTSIWEECINGGQGGEIIQDCVQIGYRPNVFED